MQPRETLPASNALRNMSAPPRMQIVLRPLHPPVQAAKKHGEPALLGILDFEALFEAGVCRGSWHRSEDRLEQLALLAESAAGTPPPASHSGHPPDEEDLSDSIVRAAAVLDPVALGLPPFAVVLPSRSQHEGPNVTDPSVAVALLTRLSGQLFIARRAPHVPPLALLDHAIGFHTMEKK